MFSTSCLEWTTDNLVKALGKVSNILRIQTSHRDSSILSQVHMSFLNQSFTLFFVQSRETIWNGVES